MGLFFLISTEAVPKPAIISTTLFRDFLSSQHFWDQAQEKDKHREKPLCNSGLTFPGAARSAGPGEAILHPMAYRPFFPSARANMRKRREPKSPGSLTPPHRTSQEKTRDACRTSHHQLLTFMHHRGAFNHVYQQRQHPAFSRIFEFPNQIFQVTREFPLPYHLYFL